MQAVFPVVVRCGRVSGLVERLHSRRGPIWGYADRDHFGYARSQALRSQCWFARSGLVTFALTCPFALLPPSTSTR